MLPVKGLRYFIVHGSGKMVHPEGGAEAPADGCNLVFCDRNASASSHFIFSDDNQLKHAVSGKFIHAKDGDADIEVPLLTNEGSLGKKTSVIMVQREGLSYLLHPSSGFYVHPDGATENPEQGVRLVYHGGYRPEVTFSVEPADQKIKVVNFDIDINALAENQPDVLSAVTVASNYTDEAKEIDSSINFHRDLSNTFNVKFNEEVAFSTSEQSSVEVYDSATFSFGYELGQIATVVKTETPDVVKETKVSRSIGPMTKIMYHMTTTRLHGTAPFTTTFEDEVTGTQFKVSGKVDVEYFFGQNVEETESELTGGASGATSS